MKDTSGELPGKAGLFATLGTMYAHTLPVSRGPQSLTWRQVPDPTPGPGEVLLQVTAVAVNRMDLAQACGRYVPPAGVAPYPGIECSGRIIAMGPDQPQGAQNSQGTQGSQGTQWQVGDECCALLNGGGYAEKVVAPTLQLLPIPQGGSLADAAALPEAACVAWSTLVMEGHLSPGQTALIEGGSGGMGSFAIQLCKALGASVVALAGSDQGLNLCWELGADVALNYRDEDPIASLRALGGANVIFDLMGASHLAQHIYCIAAGGRIVTVSLQGKVTKPVDMGILMGKLMAKRGAIITTSMRGRPATGPGSKAEVIRQVRQHVWPLIDTGLIKPVIQRRVPIRSASDVLTDVQNHTTMGKSVLLVG